jgi:hypothetical protein
MEIDRMRQREALGLRPDRMPSSVVDLLLQRPASEIPVTVEEEAAWLELEYRIGRGA